MSELLYVVNLLCLCLLMILKQSLVRISLKMTQDSFYKRIYFMNCILHEYSYFFLQMNIRLCLRVRNLCKDDNSMTTWKFHSVKKRENFNFFIQLNIMFIKEFTINSNLLTPKWFTPPLQIRYYYIYCVHFRGSPKSHPKNDHNFEISQFHIKNDIG